MAVRIRIRRDTATNFAVNNPILAQGEPALETDTRKTKMGNGTTAWNSLPYDVHPDDVAAPPLQFVLQTGNVAGDPINMDGNTIENVGNPVNIGDAANKAYVDQKALNVFRLAGSIDASTNPDYPAASKGDRFEITAGGKIGGEEGIIVEAWDEVVCTENTLGGNQEDVGSLFYITQANVMQATESVSGTIALATDEELEGGEEPNKAVTPRSLTVWFNNIIASLVEFVSNKNASGGYVGLSGFMIVFKNAANSFTSYLSNSNTASRTYGFPDKSGTVAMLDDIPTSNHRKAFYSNVVGAAVPSTVGETILDAILIPGGTVVNGDTLDIEVLYSFSSVSGSGKTFYIRANNANSLSGLTNSSIVSTISSSTSSGTTIPVKMKQDLLCRSIVSPASTLEAAYVASGANTIGVLAILNNMNIDLTQDWYVLITGKKGVSADVLELRSVQVYINKKP